MRRLLALLVVAVLAGTAGCGGSNASDGNASDDGNTSDGNASGGTDQFTQGGVSMAPTVKAGQVITVRQVGRDYKPQRGDVVLFHSNGGQWGDRTAPLLKRVVAVGGETIACCDPAGKVTVNDVPLDEPYVSDDGPLDLPPNPQDCGPRRFAPVGVATGSVFVMGDNRANSNDSRCAGPVPTASIFAVMTS